MTVLGTILLAIDTTYLKVRSNFIIITLHNLIISLYGNINRTIKY